MPVFVAVVVVADVATGGGVRKAGKSVIKAGGKVVDKVVDVARAAAKDPLPVVATIALTAVGVPAPIASAAVTAAQGGSVKDIAVAAVSAGVGGKVAGSVGGKVAGSATGKSVAAATGTSIETVSKIAASASGASSATVTAAVLQGQPLDKAIQQGLVAGVGGGVGEAASIGAQTALPVKNRPLQGAIAGGAGGAAQAAVTGQDIGTGAVLSGISTAGATALGDYRAKQEAATDQVVSAFQQPKQPGFGTFTPTASLDGGEGLDVEISGTPLLSETKSQLRGNLPAGYRLATFQEAETKNLEAMPLESGQFAFLVREEPVARTAEPTPSKTRDIITPVLASTTSFQKPTAPVRSIVVSSTNTNAMVMKPSGDVVQINTGGTQLKPNMAVNIDETTNTLVREPEKTDIREDIATEKPKESLGEVEVTGEKEPIERAPTVSQTFPLTESDQTGTKRQLINYMYANVDPTLQRPVGGGGSGMPSSTALAQALGVGDPGALYLGKKGKERRPVWNVESLKLRDELGGDYG